jgi:hypothetical protein
MKRASSIEDKNNRISQAEKERMIQSLLIMGFDNDVALFALKSTQYENVERAISFLNDKEENGKYEHPFIIFGTNTDLCKLCYEGKRSHYLDEEEKNSDEEDPFTLAELLRYGSGPSPTHQRRDSMEWLEKMRKSLNQKIMIEDGND